MTRMDAKAPQGVNPLGRTLRPHGHLGGRVVVAAVLAVHLVACERPASVAPPEGGAIPSVVPRADASEALTVAIEPRRPTAATDLTAMANDASATYAWSVNGIAVQDASDRVLSNARFRRSDTVMVEVSFNAQRARAEARIENAVPRATEVVLDRPLTALHQGLDITALPKGVDADGDDIRWEYQWIRNGEEIPDAAGPMLPGNQYQRGDRITVRVTPSDASERGQPFTPLPVTIPNGSPTFVSRPPGLQASPEYVYQVQAVDPDGDPIQYRLITAPAGMTIDAGTGALRWPLKGTSPGRHAVEIEISDGQGATASQPFELDLAPPEGT